MRHVILSVFCVGVLVLSGCDSPESTLHSLRKNVSEFAAKPTDEKQTEIDAEFAKLNGQIEQMEKAGRTNEADILRSQASDLLADYRAAKLSRAVSNTQKAVQDIGEAFKQTGQSIGQVFRDATSSGTNAPTPQPTASPSE